ncbi:DUF3060 domain-containing protein [Mycobacterium sp. 1423905.2]|uniref:DUF3060 domain-containing protein n=1 Tax=Mycobacterium sp. 1423905.2 TaxID=1856859 RepID=UPI0008024BC6|nr:DUF3060 domain-containing protein [Mycobacterium sp. 1423905.2]OBJ53387.1 hypothetical protein A9W95_18155 [Mycobacterium sp. 1423905.2]
MNPEDDPEARIRQLEQPLADAAHASEMGGLGGYRPPPGAVPPPPGPVPPPLGQTSGPSYGYGSPYPAATPRSSSGSRVFWILAALFIIGVLVGVGAIALYASRQLHRADIVVTPPSESTSALNSPPGSAEPSQTTSPTAAPGASVTVSGMNENRTLACNDNVVTISGMSNTVVISGHCAKVAVTGMNNSVTVDAADTISASGLNNKITYHSGSPKINKSGNNNVVEQG